jgi:hypothetical protein
VADDKLKISPIKRRLVDAYATLLADPPDDIGYQHTLLCQTSLPYRQPPPDVRRWERRNGKAILEIEAGRAYNPKEDRLIDVPLPYGAKARLVLIHLNSEALRTGSPCVEVDGSMTAFLKRLIGRDPKGQDIRRFKDQLTALSVAHITLAGIAENHAVQYNTQFIDRLDLWFPDNAQQRILWPSQITLSPRYFESLQNHAVPLDPRAVSALANSAMALDVYTWLAQRLHRIPDNKPQFIAWSALYDQFGLGFNRLRDFRRKFIEALHHVRAVYPDAALGEEIDGRGQPEGLKLLHSPPPVQKRLTLVTKQA